MLNNFIGPSKVNPASLDPILKFPDILSIFASFCSKDKTPERALSYSAPNEEVERVTSFMNETFISPTGPPELPWVLKWLILGISIPSI